MAGARQAPASGTERLFGDGTFAFPSRRGRIVAVGSGRSGQRDRRRLAAAAQHGTGARPVAHHDAHRHEPAPCRARRRAVPGDAPCRRRGARPAAGHARPRRDRARHRGAARHAERAPAAGLGVRADPLVGREQLRRADVRPGAARHRSDLGPARGQGDAGPRDGAAGRQPRLRPVAGRHRHRRLRLLGPRTHAGRSRDVLRACCRAARLAGLGRDAAARRRGPDLRGRAR